MEWFTKHADALSVISAIIISMIWMNGKFNDVEREISSLKTDIAIVKTVLIMKQIMPPELAKGEAEK